MPADDFTDPAATHTFAHLSALIVLSRKRASQGLYPAIDPLQSNVQDADPGRRRPPPLPHRTDVRHALAEYDELKDIIAMLGLEELSEERPPDRRQGPPPRALPDPALLHHRVRSPDAPAAWSPWTTRSTDASGF